MPRSRWWDHGDGNFRPYPPDPGPISKSDMYLGVNFITPFRPYRNMIDGKEITSRHKHREFLKINNVEEVGNEEPEWFDENRETGKVTPPTPPDDGLSEHERGKIDTFFEYQDVSPEMMEEA